MCTSIRNNLFFQKYIIWEMRKILFQFPSVELSYSNLYNVNMNIVIVFFFNLFWRIDLWVKPLSINVIVIDKQKRVGTYEQFLGVSKIRTNYNSIKVPTHLPCIINKSVELKLKEMDNIFFNIIGRYVL